MAEKDETDIFDPNVEDEESKKSLRDQAVLEKDRGGESHGGDVASPSSDVAGKPQSPLTGEPQKPQGHSDE